MTDTKEISIAELPNTTDYTSLVDDASQLLSHEAYSDHVSPEKVREGMESENGHTVVAVDKDGDLIGAGVVHIRDTMASISGVAISPEHQGQGLGTRIMSQLEQIAVANQVKTVYLTPTNNDAERLYRRLGYHEPHVDSLTFEKPIQPVKKSQLSATSLPKLRSFN